MTDIASKIEQISEGFDRFKQSYDERFDTLQSEIQRIERINGRLGAGGFRDNQPDEHTELFLRWLRNPRDTAAKLDLEGYQQKAVTTGDNNAGGYVVPEQLHRQIEQKLRDISPIRRIAHVVEVASSDFKYPLDVGGTSSGWVGEGDTRNETDTPQFEQAVPTFGTVYAYPKASEESVLDVFFDVGDWLVNRVSEEISHQEGVAFISGNGTNKPTGLLDGTPVSTGDHDSPARAFGTLQYVPTGNAGGFPNDRLGSPADDPGDVLLTTVYTLRARYRQNAVWVMNSNTAAVVRKWKDADGRYLWVESLQAGQPAMLLGYPVVIAEDMPDIAANAFPVAFGDFTRGYLIADQGNLRMTLDDNITTPGFYKWYVRKRVGGVRKDDDAVKVIKCAAS